LAILGCGGDDDDTEQLSANLTGTQEVPPNASTAAGTATLNINDERTQIDFTLNVSTALSGNIREAHIQPANVPLPPTCPTPPFTLSGTLTAANLRTITPAIQAVGVNNFADAVTQILNGNAYANVHTTTFTGGEIRGQLGRQ
jgi:hypothetical protein